MTGESAAPAEAEVVLSRLTVDDKRRLLTLAGDLASAKFRVGFGIAARIPLREQDVRRVEADKAWVALCSAVLHMPAAEEVSRQWAIRTRDGSVEDCDPFDSEDAARAACWVEGGETVVMRTVTPWREVTR